MRRVPGLANVTDVISHITTLHISHNSDWKITFLVYNVPLIIYCIAISDELFVYKAFFTTTISE